ncbi:unnamed protein product [Phytophthora lilii]|uniref:Unnamed protein product n=1 Tax=Phytophthora lilii TaxID=2077276 RepID=A0A9W6WZR8_9STRA|nr:unnamed protein product [Phytophthora lilii]
MKRFIVEKTLKSWRRLLLERDSLRVELRRSKEAQAQLVKKVEQLNAFVATHNQVYAKLAKRVQAAEDHAHSVSKQLVREQEVFKATVAANTAQSSRLHRLLANSDVADDSASARLRLRNEDLMERVQRLVKANRTLRARVQLEEMDPDVLVLVSEARGAQRSREECALDRELESSSRRPRLAADAAGQRAVDGSRDVTSSRGETADMETSVGLEFSSPAPSASRSTAGSRSSGVSKAKSKSLFRSRRQYLTSTCRSSRASAAQSSFKSSLMRELEDADDEDVLGDSSPPLTPPRSSSRPIVIDDDSDDDSESGVESERMTVPKNTMDSRTISLSAGSEASAVPRSNVSGHSPAREASASGALALSDGLSTVPNSREVAMLEVGSPPVAATRESESSASTALVVRDSSIPAPPPAKTGAVRKSAAKTQAKAKKTNQKKKRARSTKAPSESSVPGVAPSEPSAAARSSTSRPQSRRRQANRPQVDASMSSLPGLDSSSLRPVPIPGPVHGDQPQVRFSKQVIKWARPYMTPKFKLPGASKCWSRILNRRLLIPVPSHTRVPCTAAQIEAFADYKNPRHPWQVVRRQLPPHACLFSTVDFDVNASVSAAIGEVSGTSVMKRMPTSVVHISRLKPVNEYSDRPKTRLAPDITENSRLDFDEELLPDDSWEPDHLAGEYEVEVILDDRTPMLTSTERAVRDFKVKWVGYDDPTWEPASNLSCGGLLYDYLRRKGRDQRFQMVQVADED